MFSNENIFWKQPSQLGNVKKQKTADKDLHCLFFKVTSELYVLNFFLKYTF